METFRAIFDDIPDTRYKNAQYDLTEIIFIALTAVLCGADSEEPETAFTKEKSHGRQEVRTGSVIVDANLETAFDFPGLTAIGRIESNRDGATAIRYYALSKPLKPGELLSIVRLQARQISIGCDWGNPSTVLAV